MKKFLIGFISGAVLCGSLAAVAVEYNIYPNPYKVVVDGKEVAIEGYNINDKSYFQLRDIGNAVGFQVGFDAANETVLVSTDPNAVMPDTKPADEFVASMPVTIPDPMYIESETLGVVTNDEFQIKVWSKDENITVTNIIDKANEIVGYKRFGHFIGDIVEEDSLQVVHTNIHSSCVSIEEYYQRFYPWLKSLQQ